jgi:hypothetical protein
LNLQHEDNQGTKRYNVPQILVICPDTYNVVDLNKLLVEKYKDFSGLKPDNGAKYDVHIFKLFAKHIKPEEQKETLSQKHPNAKVKRVLNVYVGTPNRLLKLLSMEAFDLGELSDRFRHMIIDCRIGPKGFSIFEGMETRVDTLELLIEANSAFARDTGNKLKVSLV